MHYEKSRAQIPLILGFTVILFSVPAYQVLVEMRARQPVQFTDLFRHPPTVRNLRRFEQVLEDGWWGRETVRPRMQGALLLTLRDTGHKALAGRGGWLFYKPAVRYLIRADREETGRSRRDSVAQAIVTYRDQLAERGIELLVVPVPSKAAVYPEMLTRRAAADPGDVRSPAEDLLEALRQKGVKTVDLFQTFRAARRDDAASGTNTPLYLARDTHWTPEGARIAARAVGEQLRAIGWSAEFPLRFTAEEARVGRSGDIVDMMSVPGLAGRYPEEPVHCTRILDPIIGPLVPLPGARDGRFKNDHLLDTPMEPSVLLLGDSYCRIYQTAEPASLGQALGPNLGAHAGDGEQDRTAPTTRPLLPGSAGFPSLLAHELKAPVDYIISDGGAATDVRRRLSIDAEMLEGKRFIVWEFTERDIRLGAAGWQDVELPLEL